MEIKVGDYINGFEIESISKDPFVKGQINIETKAIEIDSYGDRSPITFRITPKEKLLKGE